MIPESVLDACATIRTCLTEYQPNKGDTRHDNPFHCGGLIDCVPELKARSSRVNPIGEHVPRGLGGSVVSINSEVLRPEHLSWRACNRSCQSGSVAALPPSTIHFFGGLLRPLLFAQVEDEHDALVRTLKQRASNQPARGCRLSGELLLVWLKQTVFQCLCQGTFVALAQFGRVRSIQRNRPEARS